MTKDRKPLKMGTCHVCRKVDGWGLTMLDHNSEPRTICRTCHGTPCANAGCKKLYSPDNPPVEHRIYFGERRDESEVWCQTCHVENML